jgi:glutamate formiminotransferase/formiminotetrahydrofolate cyclodeaminase
MHHAFEAAVEAADGAGVRITGSEIVGLVPKQALIDAGLYYIKKQRGSTACSEKAIIETAAASLGLDEVAPFDPHEKIIEYRIRGFSGAQVEGQVIGPD